MRAIFKSPAGVLLGIGIAAAAPIVVPAAVAAGRPILKAAIKRYLGLRESMGESVAVIRDGWRRLVAEAKAERAAEPVAPAAGPVPSSTPMA